jgi:hypothetical protein
MISFREFALACDLYRSLSLIRYQVGAKTIKSAVYSAISSNKIQNTGNLGRIQGTFSGFSRFASNSADSNDSQLSGGPQTTWIHVRHKQ